MKALIIVAIALSLTACGKTKDALMKVLHDAIDVPANVYEDAKDNTKTVKDAVTPAQDSTGK